MRNIRKKYSTIGEEFERGDYTLEEYIDSILASGWVLVCSVYSAIIHFLYSDSIMLDVLKSKCRRNGSRQNGSRRNGSKSLDYCRKLSAMSHYQLWWGGTKTKS